MIISSITSTLSYRKSNVEEKVKTVTLQVNEACDECKAEMQKATGSQCLPETVAEMKKELLKELEKCTATLKNIVHDLSTASLEALEEEMKEHNGEVKTVLAEYMAAVNPAVGEVMKAVSAFRRTYKKFSGQAAKKNKPNQTKDFINDAHQIVQAAIAQGRTAPTTKVLRKHYNA